MCLFSRRMALMAVVGTLSVGFLVIGQVGAASAAATPAGVYNVDKTADTGDAAPGDGICDDGSA